MATTSKTILFWGLSCSCLSSAPLQWLDRLISQKLSWLSVILQPWWLCICIVFLSVIFAKFKSLFVCFNHHIIAALNPAGDCDYTVIQWFLNPFLNPQSADKGRDNNMHSLMCSIMECTTALLNGWWWYPDVSSEKVCHIVRACAVLYNMTQQKGLPFIRHLVCCLVDV